MAKTKQITYGFIAVIVAAVLVVVINSNSGLKIDISKTDSKFYIYNNATSNWDLSGLETWEVQSSKNISLKMSSASLKNNPQSDNKTSITRVSKYSGVVINENYYFDGNAKDITEFPISHSINIVCKDCVYKYKYELYSPRMQIQYDEPDVIDGNTLIYKIKTNRIINIRLFDPIVSTNFNMTIVNNVSLLNYNFSNITWSEFNNNSYYAYRLLNQTNVVRINQ